MPENTYTMSYEALSEHVGHKIEVKKICNWVTDRESGIEIRCREDECEFCEPLLEMDNPQTSQ